MGETDGTRYLVSVDSLFQILRGRTSEEESAEADELLLATDEDREGAAIVRVEFEPAT